MRSVRGDATASELGRCGDGVAGFSFALNSLALKNAPLHPARRGTQVAASRRNAMGGSESEGRKQALKDSDQRES